MQFNYISQKTIGIITFLGLHNFTNSTDLRLFDPEIWKKNLIRSTIVCEDRQQPDLAKNMTCRHQIWQNFTKTHIQQVQLVLCDCSISKFPHTVNTLGLTLHLFRSVIYTCIAIPVIMQCCLASHCGDDCIFFYKFLLRYTWVGCMKIAWKFSWNYMKNVCFLTTNLHNADGYISTLFVQHIAIFWFPWYQQQSKLKLPGIVYTPVTWSSHWPVYFRTK